MPNWCQNILVVRSKTSRDLQEFISKSFCEADGSDAFFTLSGTHPMPKELENTPTTGMPEEEKQRLIEKYGSANWYDWRIDNWGCKWDVEGEIVGDFQKDLLRVEFESPWEPPRNWLKYVSIQFPNCKFLLKYREEGNQFAGETFAFRNKFHDNCWAIHELHEEELEKDDWD